MSFYFSTAKRRHLVVTLWDFHLWFLNAYPTDSYGFKINLHTPYLNNIVHLYFLNTDLDCYIWAAENVIHNSTLFVGNKMDLSAFEWWDTMDPCWDIYIRAGDAIRSDSLLSERVCFLLPSCLGTSRLVFDVSITGRCGLIIRLKCYFIITPILLQMKPEMQAIWRAAGRLK